MSKEAMKLALEALVIEDLACRYMKETTPDYIDKAITALQKALANEALDKMAENARELGLDYEPALQKPVGCEGAVVNGRVYADRLEHDYKFECEAGPLHLCTDWVEFRRCFEWLAQHTSPPAQRTWVGLTDDRSHQILLDMAKHIETFGDESTTEQALSAECIRFILERVTAHGIKEKA